MDPIRPSGVGSSSAGSGKAADAGPWRVGQQLRALVLRGTPAEAGGGDALVRIGRHAVHVRAQLPLVQGERLAVQVARLDPTPVLRLMRSPTDAPVRAEPTAQAATRVLLPRQSGLAPLFAVLVSADAHPPASAPQPLRSAIQNLLAGLLRSDQAGDPAALRQALFNAGFAFEARAAAGRPVGGDLKSLLIQLLKAAEAANPEAPRGSRDLQAPPPPRREGAPTPQPRLTGEGFTPAETRELAGQLRRLAEGALARTALHQITAADAERSGLFQIHGELPLHDGDGIDVVQFRIERDAPQRREQGAAATWTFALALDLPGLGPVHAHIGLHEQTVSTRFWAEREATCHLIEGELPSLGTLFGRCGLRASELSCHPGRPPAPAGQTEAGSGVLDTSA